MPERILKIFPDARALHAAVAEQFVTLAAEAVSARGRFIVALSGGSTPRVLHQTLTEAKHQARVDWARVFVIFGDERCVPHDDASSNYGMACATLFNLVPLPASNIYRIRGEDEPARAAFEYEQTLRELFRGETTPATDLIFLGVGQDGHTASLFPNTAALREQTRWVVAQYVQAVHAWRITVTVPFLNSARNISFLAQGADKANSLSRVLQGPYEPEILPAQMIQPARGNLFWFADASAASQLAAETK